MRLRPGRARQPWRSLIADQIVPRESLSVTTDPDLETDQLAAGFKPLVVDDTGVWIRGDEVLHQWMVDRGEKLRREAMGERMDDKAMTGLLRSIRPLFDPRQLGRVREMAAASLVVHHEKYRGINAVDGWDFGVTTCLDTELDCARRYIGTKSGVVDLYTGKLLAPAEGRRHLVTQRAPVKWDPDAAHPDVDRLFAHLPSDEREWFWKVLGYALRVAECAYLRSCRTAERRQERPSGRARGHAWPVCRCTVVRTIGTPPRRRGERDRIVARHRYDGSTSTLCPV